MYRKNPHHFTYSSRHDPHVASELLDVEIRGLVGQPTKLCGWYYADWLSLNHG